jgi:transposase-like protein
MAAPVGPKKVKRYSDEFKIQAVKLASHPDIQTKDVARARERIFLAAASGGSSQGEVT